MLPARLMVTGKTPDNYATFIRIAVHRKAAFIACLPESNQALKKSNSQMNWIFNLIRTGQPTCQSS
ncbi:hypothetical protein Nizo2264_1740 [Lactiplantibacillus plantarum]|uniref:Uncharacterized protein n=1 Tax=Lactiplantibacillus argentoratensis TaxID=271881 RepID=A0AAN1PZZ8_9LACO|nr:hypothetical protein LPA65_04620 [Lactiplantibacillus argentoratensis]KZU13096.1 hypothetical protein Nizo2264_1740 [Lactiplantibacillus plantarum]